MEIVLRAAALAVVGVLLGLTVRKHTPELAAALALAVLYALAVLCGGMLQQVVDFMTRIGDLAGVSPASAAIVLKTVGISIVVRITAALCRELGHQSAAAGVEFAGCCAALFVSIPLLESVLDMILSFT